MLGSASFPKLTPTQVFLVDITKFLRIVFSYNTAGGCFWQSYYGTVKPAGVPVLWFHTSMCFQFWSKTFTKHCSNNSLLSRDKSISSLLEFTVTCFWFQNMFWRNINCFRFWLKIYTKRCTSNYEISNAKQLSSPALWSGAFNFRAWFGKRNMAVKIQILILFLFCLLHWLKNHLFWVLL